VQAENYLFYTIHKPFKNMKQQKDENYDSGKSEIRKQINVHTVQMSCSVAIICEISINSFCFTLCRGPTPNKGLFLNIAKAIYIR
jgi:hypothetical protein